MFLYSVGPSHIDQVIQCDLLHVTAYVTARVPILLLNTPTLKKRSELGHSYPVITLVNVNAPVVATTCWWLHFTAPVVA